MTSIAESVFLINQHGVIHNDLGNPSNIMLMHTDDGSQKPVIIDFGRALSPLEQIKGPVCVSKFKTSFKEDRVRLFESFKYCMAAVATYHWFERFFADRMHDPRWKSFLMDMDYRETEEWKPWSEREWETARKRDENLRRSWEERYGKQ
jgi:serine/threonine protein kinase